MTVKLNVSISLHINTRTKMMLKEDGSMASKWSKPYLTFSDTP